MLIRSLLTDQFFIVVMVVIVVTPMNSIRFKKIKKISGVFHGYPFHI